MIGSRDLARRNRLRKVKEDDDKGEEEERDIFLARLRSK